MGFTSKDGDPSLPELHAGDEVSVFAQADHRFFAMKAHLIGAPYLA